LKDDDTAARLICVSAAELALKCGAKLCEEGSHSTDVLKATLKVLSFLRRQRRTIPWIRLTVFSRAYDIGGSFCFRVIPELSTKF
jgi:hypothetical protein